MPDQSDYCFNELEPNYRQVGRIVIADVFDAFTSMQPYKMTFPIEKAISIIGEGAVEHCDPRLLAIFEQIEPKLYHDISGQEK